MAKISLASDYLEGAHPAVLKSLCDTNMLQTSGYGTDEFCDSARERIRKICECPNAAVHFLVGGTQTNATVIDSILKSYQGVIAADSGHISTHEASAIELGGHKVMTIPHENGKISADAVRKSCETYHNDANRDHMTMPGMVYISQPTEFGTLYSLKELTDISAVCREFQIPLYVDGARLAYALACAENDVSLADMARLCDVFYIGGTKCGALFGEAVVIPNPELIPHFFTIIKQHGALLAKGRLLGVQFDALFTDDLYLKVGVPAINGANRLRDVLRKKAYTLVMENPTNQVFVKIENKKLEEISRSIDYSFWEAADENHTVVRFATSWATTEEILDKVVELL